jgi:hypothetical protein
MEGERFREGAPVQLNPTGRFFTNGVMAILNFKLVTWQITIGVHPELPHPLGVQQENLWSANFPAIARRNPAYHVFYRECDSNSKF